jgi:hypothetical protein
MKAHSVRWTAPSPLWTSAPAEGEKAIPSQPAILRFATDSFMDEFLAMLERDPSEMKGLIAPKGETWRKPLAPSDPSKPLTSMEKRLKRLQRARDRLRPETQQSKGGDILKLYQPAHQRHYLLAACLLCEPTILGDHKLNTALQERVSYVIRRMIPEKIPSANDPLGTPGDPNQKWNEHAFVSTANGKQWKQLTNPAGTLEETEELLPLSPVSFVDDDGRKRRLFISAVPVARREEYMAVSTTALESLKGDRDNAVERLMVLARTQVLQPWKGLIDIADRAKTAQFMEPPEDAEQPAPPSKDEKFPDEASLSRALKSTREQIQTGSWFILLDFAKFLSEHLTNVWNAIGISGAKLQYSEESNLLHGLYAAKANHDIAGELYIAGIYEKKQILGSLGSALESIKTSGIEKIESNLDSITKSYNRNNPESMWPSFLFPLSDSKFFDQALPKADVDGETRIIKAFKRVDHLKDLIEAALKAQTSLVSVTTPMPLASKAPVDTREGWFIIRCVFDRPACGPDLQPPVLSEKTELFQLAGLYDPDAPARPIRIVLPLDTTPAGLRKFDKNTAFMMSDILCGQIERVKGLSFGDLVRSVLPWPFHKDLSVPDAGPCKGDAGMTAGMICTLSIPIITICALILLMIFVSLLDIIFRWLPNFMMCFPLPGFKGKKGS